MQHQILNDHVASTNCTECDRTMAWEVKFDGDTQTATARCCGQRYHFVNHDFALPIAVVVRRRPMRLSLAGPIAALAVFLGSLVLFDTND